MYFLSSKISCDKNKQKNKEKEIKYLKERKLKYEKKNNPIPEYRRRSLMNSENQI